MELNHTTHNHMEGNPPSSGLISSLNKQRNKEQIYEVTKQNPRAADKDRTETWGSYSLSNLLHHSAIDHRQSSPTE